MTQVQKLQRRDLILAGIAVLLLAYIALRPSETSAVTEEALPKLLPELQVENVRSLILGADDDRVELRRKDDETWVIASAHDYPATATKVNALLEKLLSIRRRALITRRAETFDQYEGGEGWVKLEALDALGKPLASFSVGKTAKWPDSYVLIEEAGTPLIVRAANLQPHDVRTTLESWSEARLWPDLALPDVSRIDVVQKEEGRTLSFVRTEVEVEPTEGEEGAEPTTKTVWVMEAPEQEGEKPEADTFKVEGLIRSFTGMRLTDIAGGGAADAATGLADPAYRVVVSGKAPGVGRRPPEYVLEVGGKVPAEGADASADAETDGWYVRRGGDAFVFAVASYAIGDFRKSPEEFLPEPEEPEAPAEPEEAPGGAISEQAAGSPDDAPLDGAMPGPPPVLPPVDPPTVEPVDPPVDEPKDVPPDEPKDVPPDEPKDVPPEEPKDE